MYYDPCKLGAGKQKTNLRRVPARILSSGNNRRKKRRVLGEDIEASRPVHYRPVQQAAQKPKNLKERPNYTDTNSEKNNLLKSDGTRNRNAVGGNLDIDISKSNSNRHGHRPERPNSHRKSHHRRSSKRGSSDGSSESGRRSRMTSSSEGSENTHRKRAKTGHKRTASAPVRTSSFLRETTL